jgi:O-antigen/teichoic acid export membrane protein
MYYVLIGKLFSPEKLGYYSKADGFQKLPTSTIDIIIRQVTYPALAEIQNEQTRLKHIYKTMIKVTSFLIFILLFGLAAIAKPLILTLIGAKWLPSVPYLQLLCFVGVFYPLISINSNLLNVKGRSDLSLAVMVLKVLLSFPALFIGYYFGISVMILGMIGASMCLLLFILFMTNNMIKYSVKEQVTDICKSFIFAFTVVFPVFLLGKILHFEAPLSLLILLLSGFALYILTGELSKNNEYNMIKELVMAKIHLRRVQH